MKQAINLALEILRKQQAIKNSSSSKLLNDYIKSIKKDKKELILYCKIKGIDINKVWKQATNK